MHVIDHEGVKNEIKSWHKCYADESHPNNHFLLCEKKWKCHYYEDGLK